MPSDPFAYDDHLLTVAIREALIAALEADR